MVVSLDYVWFLMQEEGRTVEKRYGKNVLQLAIKARGCM